MDKTDETVTDNEMTGDNYDDLDGKNLAKGRHYLDTGYFSDAVVVSALRTWGNELIGMLLADNYAQERDRCGYERDDYNNDYDESNDNCEKGKKAVYWTKSEKRGKDDNVDKYYAGDCGY